MTGNICQCKVLVNGGLYSAANSHHVTFSFVSISFLRPLSRAEDEREASRLRKNYTGYYQVRISVTHLYISAFLSGLWDTIVASWSIQDLGWTEARVLTLVANVASRFDLISVQEVMSDDAAQLEQALEGRTVSNGILLFACGRLRFLQRALRFS